ncbi:PTS system, sucrose-specific IIB component [Geobacillus stearothermophilus]|uniref:PTS system, sucrose-specific IIB component n=1 Tax=Geobacillus stearothermophilus TaxID=1422 RepID=A0A150N219_GEOSE|nr:PTS system, sucrose-specific IIB component [Geobacillus stearothermophilus]
MNYEHIAKQLIPLLGGKENIISATHCATRLRLVLKDEKKVDAKTIENIEGVKGAFSSSGQFQIIFGTGVVNKVYEAFVREAGIQQGDADARVSQDFVENIFSVHYGRCQ